MTTITYTVARCVYCSWPVKSGNLVCGNHADLPPLDPGLRLLRMRRWWLARFTPLEIRDLAAGLTVPQRKAEPIEAFPQEALPDRLQRQGA